MLRSIIVDDELKSREVIKTLLDNFCPEVEVVDMAEDIEGALTAIREHTPDLVFLDITLKEGDSFQILRQLKKIDFEIIFVTAYDEYSIKALKYSGITCLFKPLDIDELQNAVRKVAKRETNMNTAYKMVNGILKSGFTKVPVITPGGLVFTSVEDITYIISSNQGSVIHFLDKNTVQSRREISEFQDIIISDSFRMMGSDIFVNTNHLDTNRTSKKQLTFANGETLETGSYDFSRFLDLFR